MIKSKSNGKAQEIVLPDFPDDETTVTKSRRVSFGTNFIKEFIVGSAVSAQCMSEYEQAFPSSDSSNADSSHSTTESEILNHNEFIVQESLKIHKSAPAVIQLAEPDSVESRPKPPTFSRTICFSADSPTADMEFTEGCLTLAKSILDKKNKEMTVIIQAKSKEPKEEEKPHEEETKYFEGSEVEMSVTRCLKSKENKREEKRMEIEKTKIFNKFENDMSITKCNRFYNESDMSVTRCGRVFNEDDSDNSMDDCKENQVPLDVIIRHLDKDNSDLENDLFNPEKSFSNFLNGNPFDFSNDSEKLNLNESMDISIDIQPQNKTNVDMAVPELPAAVETTESNTFIPTNILETSENILSVKEKKVDNSDQANFYESMEISVDAEPTADAECLEIQQNTLSEDQIEISVNQDCKQDTTVEKSVNQDCKQDTTVEKSVNQDCKQDTTVEKSVRHDDKLDSTVEKSLRCDDKQDTTMEKSVRCDDKQDTTMEKSVRCDDKQDTTMEKSVRCDDKQDTTMEKSVRHDKLDTTVEKSFRIDDIQDPTMEKSIIHDEKQDISNEPNTTDEPEQNSTFDREPLLVDVKVIESLKEQSKEPGCVWSLKDWRHPQVKTLGLLSFNCALLESTATIQFNLKISNEDGLGSCSIVKSNEVSLNEENKCRLPEYNLAVEFGFEGLKNFFQERRQKLGTIRHIPYFLDEINSFTTKMNSYLLQIYSILTAYPGSRLKGSLLSFRLYSFPVFFSCTVSIDLSDLFRLSKTSLAFEQDFGSLDENKIREIFEECLKSKNSLCEFVIQSTKYLISLEKKSGYVSKRQHIRLLPTELKL